MLNSKTLFVAALIVAIGLVLVVLIPRWIGPDVNNDSLYKKLEAERDSLRDINISLRVEFDSMQVLVDSLGGKIGKEKTKVIYIKQKANEKFVLIGNYSNDELYRFYAGIKTPTIAGR